MTAAAASFVLDRRAVRAVDRAAVEEYGVPGIVLMENAARALADAGLEMLAARGGPEGARVILVCGRGNNGGDGWALARHLHNAGAEPLVVPLGAPEAGSDAATNAAICARMELPVHPPERLADAPAADLVVDAIFGTGLDRPVEGAAQRAIDWINAARRPVLAVDVPSGLDCDRGVPLGACVRATRTVTFVAMKPGLLTASGRAYAGAVTVGDIGCPRELVERYAWVEPAGDRGPS
jgi:NAD(P)H-hydrate epimerase